MPQFQMSRPVTFATVRLDQHFLVAFGLESHSNMALNVACFHASLRGFAYVHAAAEVPTIWDQLAENTYLKGSPAAEVALSAGTSVSFARVRRETGLPEIGRSLVGQHGYLVALQLKAIPFIEEFFGRKRVSSGSYLVGGVSAIDLRNEPALLLPNPFDALVLYLTQGALDEVAFAHQASRVEQLKWPLGGVDLTVYQLGPILLSSLDQSQRMSRLFLDHVLHALKCHLVWSYGGVGLSAPRFRGGLSSLQMRTATELLDANQMQVILPHSCNQTSS